MPQFKYRARLSDGRIGAGLIEAETQEAAMDALQERSMTVLVLEPVKNIELAARGSSLFNRVSSKDLVAAVRSLSVMTNASVPLADGLRNVARQSANPRLARTMLDIAAEVEGGGKLSDALEKHPNLFSGFFVNMVRSGETTGQLGEVLEYLADQQEKDYDLNAKISGAMIYPGFILGTMVVMGFIMMTFVVPKLVQVLAQANVALPWTTRALIATSNFFAAYWWLMLIGAAAVGVAYHYWSRTPVGRYTVDRFKLSAPVLGSIFREMYVVRFCRSLATLLKGGVDLVDALEIVAGVLGNEVWKRAVYDTIREVNDGNSIVTVLQKEKFVPTMMVQLLAVGESTGQTQIVLAKLSEFYSREIDNVVDNITKLIEPIVIILLGLGVGVLVSAIMLPLYSLSSGG